MQLQKALFQQLTDNKSMPKSATESEQSALRELIKSAKGKLVLLVLDGGSDACNDDTRNVSSHICVCALDMWSREHAEPFDCVDATNDSKLLVTTRFAAEQVVLLPDDIPFS